MWRKNYNTFTIKICNDDRVNSVIRFINIRYWRCFYYTYKNIKGHYPEKTFPIKRLIAIQWQTVITNRLKYFNPISDCPPCERKLLIVRLHEENLSEVIQLKNKDTEVKEVSDLSISGNFDLSSSQNAAT
jgi:hypothetical protein